MEITNSQVKIFKILADPARLSIIKLLIKVPEGLCVYEIAEKIGLSHSATSHQLSKLESNGILDSERIGQSVCYRINKSKESEKLLKMNKMDLI